MHRIIVTSRSQSRSFISWSWCKVLSISLIWHDLISTSCEGIGWFKLGKNNIIIAFLALLINLEENKWKHNTCKNEGYYQHYWRNVLNYSFFFRCVNYNLLVHFCIFLLLFFNNYRFRWWKRFCTKTSFF